jgi:REP element-mobilizing transposase RayT
MPRALRIEFEGAVYHVMARGQRRAPIVMDDHDRRRWLDTLEQAVSQAGWKVLAYALMGNHYHLLIETPQPTLVSGMKWLQSAYATRYRVRHRLVGSVFSGRYKALLIEADNRHLGTVMDYIHLNGWRAAQTTIAKGLEDTPWCSLQWYGVARRKRPPWLSVVEGLRWHELDDTAAGRRAFIERLEERARLGTRRSDESREEELNWKAALRRGWYYGSDLFGEKVLARAKQLLSGQKDCAQVDFHVRRAVGEAEASRLLNLALERWDWPAFEPSRRRKGDRQKAVLAWFIRQKSGAGLKWIQQHLHTGAIAATSRLIAVAARSARSRETSRWIAELQEISK